MSTWRRWAEFGNMAVRSSVSGEFTIHKNAPMAGFFSMKEGNSPNFALDGWGGRDRTSEWGNQNPLPYRLATPQQTRQSAVYRHRAVVSTGKADFTREIALKHQGNERFRRPNGNPAKAPGHGGRGQKTIGPPMHDGGP